MRKQICFLIYFGIAQAAFSQTDSVVFAGKTGNDGNATLYNGRVHVGYLNSIEGSAYYGANEWQSGTLIFQGVPYRDVLLKYDLVADEVLVLHPNGFTGVTLFTPRIQSFRLGDRSFVALPDHQPSDLKAGLYEELSKGKVSLYAKRSKLIKETTITTGVERKFIDQSFYYIWKDDAYYAVRNEKAIFDILVDKKNDLADWMKASNINYKSSPENALLRIVAYYNQLSL